MGASCRVCRVGRLLLVLWDIPTSINDAIPALPNRLYCNRILTAPLEKAFRNLIARGHADELKTWDGCFNIRYKRGKDSWSLHSWAVAIDVNAAWNPFGESQRFRRDL